MPAPLRKPNASIAPRTRPNLRVIDGGSETTSDRGNLQPVPSSLADAESRPNLRVIDGGGETTSDRGNLSMVDGVRDAETTPSPSWNVNLDSSTDKRAGMKTSTRAVYFAKKIAPSGGIVGILIAGMLGVGTVAPGLALVHIKEIVENRINTMASVVDTRMQKIIAGRMAGSSTKCTALVKIRCQFQSFSDEQLKTLKEKGIKVVDATGREISGGEKPGSGGKMIFPDGNEYTARNFNSSIRTDAVLRKNMQQVFPTRYNVWNDKIGGTFMSAKKLVRNPKSPVADNGGNSKEDLVEINKNIQQNNLQGDDIMSGIDPDGFRDPINEEIQSINANIADGVSVDLDSSPAGVLNSPDTGIGKFETFKGVAMGALNPLNMAVGACTSRNYMKTIVSLSKLAGTVEAMRFGMHVLASADKLKAGDAKPSDVSIPMNQLYKNNSVGDSFGDSVGYHYAAYGKTTNSVIEAGISGSAILTFFTASLLFMNRHLSKDFLDNGCGLITSLIGQAASVALATVLTIISGGSSAILTKTGSAAAETGMKLAVKRITDALAESLSKDAIKASLKNNRHLLIKQGATMVGFFLAGMLISKYFTPYVARLATGTIFSGDMNGVAAMDVIVKGAGEMNAGIAQSRGLTAMTPDQAIAFAEYNNQATATYIADRKREAEPYDLNNPYSMASTVMYPLGNFVASIDVMRRPSSLFSLPFSVLGAITNPISYGSGIASATSSSDDTKALMAECQDYDATQEGTVATDPYCTALYGFTNVSDLVDISPDQVVTYMGSNGYIDDNGDPINSYAEYVATCFTGSTDKIISSLTDANNLDEKCYKEDVALSQNISKEMYTMFHLYQIDKNVVVQMDSPYDPTQETIDSNESSPTQDNYALPVDQKFFDDHETNEPNPELKWFSKPHHDYPAADIPVPLGTNVYAITSGKITAAPNEGGYGRGVTILGDDGVVYNYGHGSDGGSVPGAGNGDVVKAGQLIMHSANTGHSFGAHLHVDMRYNGNKLCPQSLFLALGNKTTIPNTVRLPTSGCSY